MKRLHSILLAFVLAPTSNHVFSLENISFIPRIETGLLDYDARFKWSTQTLDGQAVSFENSFQTFHSVIRLGATIAWKDLYFDTYYQATSDDSDDFNFPQALGGGSESFDGDRQEYAFTVGYSFYDSASVFFGHRHSDAEASGHLRSDYNFVNDALFLGASYSWQISDNNLLSVNLAYAHLYDADIDIRVRAGSQNVEDANTIANGDGDGVKASVSLRGLLSKELSYSLTLDGFRYEYDNLDDSNSGNSLDLRELEIIYRIGLSYAF